MCAGKLVVAVGKDKFPSDYIETFTKFALGFIAYDQSKFEMRETGLSYFAEISRVM